jgi:hypothetical protein
MNMKSKQKINCINEIRILATLQGHPHILTYRESFIDQEILCLITDLAD